MADASHSNHEHAHTSTFGYLMVFLALMVGTALTVWISFMNLGKLGNALAALAIACCKASLVLYFFMHVRESARIIGVIAFGSFLWLSILFIFTLGDYLSRSDKWIPKAQAFDPADIRRLELDEKWRQYQHDLRFSKPEAHAGEAPAAHGAEAPAAAH